MSSRPDLPMEAVVEACQAMGTRFEIVLPVEGAGRPRYSLQAAAHEVLNEVERLEAQLSMYRASSEISGLNAYAAEEPVRVEPRLFRFLVLAQYLSRETDGAFDPTVAPLLRCWGFTGGGGRVPSPEEIAAARELTGVDLVELDDESFTARFLREGVRLDLGAIGKGYALDRALELLEDAGVANALIHGGTSTVYGLGDPSDAEQGRGWRVALRDPRPDAAGVLGEVRLRNRALSVSAPHGKSFREGDRLFGHVLDPRTGEPARAGLMAAVGHPCATITDALSTALLVLGPEGVPPLESRFPEADMLLVTEEEGMLRIRTGGPGEWGLTLRDDRSEAPAQKDSSQ